MQATGCSAVEGGTEEPALTGIFPHFITLTTDWWPEHVSSKTDTYYPIPTMGIYSAGVGSLNDNWNLVITKFECDRYKIKIDDSDSVINVKVTTSTPQDLLVFLVDPKGNLRAPDIPDWNGGEIRPIHEWNGMDDPAIPPDPDDWRAWEPEDHTEFSAEVLHPEKGTWQALVVPRYTTGSSSIRYTITGNIKTLSQERINAAISGANAGRSLMDMPISLKTVSILSKDSKAFGTHMTFTSIAKRPLA